MSVWLSSSRRASMRPMNVEEADEPRVNVVVARLPTGLCRPPAGEIRHRPHLRPRVPAGQTGGDETARRKGFEHRFIGRLRDSLGRFMPACCVVGSSRSASSTDCTHAYVGIPGEKLRWASVSNAARGRA